MENLLRDGDYAPNGFGGFTRLSGAQEVLARALFRLTCRKGSFPFLPELGSPRRGRRWRSFFVRRRSPEWGWTWRR